MSSNTVRNVRDVAETTLVETAWAQWNALTASAASGGGRAAWTIVDPEALVLASLSVVGRERRLDDILSAWATHGACLMSVQRMRTLAQRFPDRVRSKLVTFASRAVAGGDRRWASLVRGEGAAGESVSREKSLAPIRLLEGPALTLRLRGGFGVGAKADILAILLGRARAPSDIKLLAAAAAYTGRAVRAAAEEMASAGFIHQIAGRPPAYYAEPEAWAHLLTTSRSVSPDRPTVPPWRYWAGMFEFMAAVSDWAEEATSGDWTDYAAGSKARDLVEKHAGTLRQAQIEVRPEIRAAGDGYLGEFEALVVGVRAWADEGLCG